MDREKVIEALETCRDQDNPPGYRFTSCKDDCPYSGNGCARRLKEEALAMLKEQETDIGNLNETVKNLLDAYTEIKAIYGDSVRVVGELVRCKDCKHSGCRTQNVDGSIFRVVCKKHSTKRNERWMDADWFCADGERK